MTVVLKIIMLPGMSNGTSNVLTVHLTLRLMKVTQEVPKYLCFKRRIVQKISSSQKFITTFWRNILLSNVRVVIPPYCYNGFDRMKGRVFSFCSLDTVQLWWGTFNSRSDQLNYCCQHKSTKDLLGQPAIIARGAGQKGPQKVSKISSCITDVNI